MHTMWDWPPPFDRCICCAKMIQTCQPSIGWNSIGGEKFKSTLSVGTLSDHQLLITMVNVLSTPNVLSYSRTDRFLRPRTSLIFRNSKFLPLMKFPVESEQSYFLPHQTCVIARVVNCNVNSSHWIAPFPPIWVSFRWCTCVMQADSKLFKQHQQEIWTAKCAMVLWPLHASFVTTCNLNFQGQDSFS